MPDDYLDAALNSITPNGDEPPPAVSIEALKTVQDCYRSEFVRAFSACNLSNRFDIRQALKSKFPKFSPREFDRRVDECEKELRQRLSDSGALPWHEHLLTTDKGKVLAVTENALIAFRCAPEWQGVLNYDLSSLNVVVKATPPWGDKRPLPWVWTDQDDTRAAAWLQREGILLPPKSTAEAIQTVATENEFHPVRDYLSGLPIWDKVERIDYWLENFLGVRAPQDGDIQEAADTLAYIRDVSAKFLVGAIARAMQPGCKHDTCLVLEGPQGIKKSTALSTMFEPWFTDDMPDLHTKDASLQTRGVWLIELGELDSVTSKADIGKLKAFLSRKVDRVRPPYGRRAITSERDSVFAGSVNKATYFMDETGGRRFWPVSCGEIDIPGLKAARPQLWAEALARYNAPDSSWWISDTSIISESTRQQEARYEHDPWQDLITRWLESPKQRFLTAQDPIEPFTSTSDSTTVLEVLLHAIGKRAEQITTSDHIRVGRCMRFMKWQRRRPGTAGNRQWRYEKPI